MFAAMCCLVWGLPAAAQASSSPPEVQTEPAQPIPGGAKLKGNVNPGGLPTTYYFIYARDTCDEGCTPSKTTTSGPLTGDTTQEVPAVEVTGLSGGRKGIGTDSSQPTLTAPWAGNSSTSRPEYHYRR